MEETKKVTSKEFLSMTHHASNKRISFNTYIYNLRKMVFLKHSYIMSAVDYDSILLDLIDFGVLPSNIMPHIEWNEDDEV